MITAMLRLTVNGNVHELQGPLTVAQLVAHFGLDGRLVAVERNREVVPRAEHATTQLADGDVVEIVHFVGGG